MGLLNLLLKDPASFLILSVLLLYAVIFHELAHGWIAYKLGDHTAKWLGRLTLNPIKHLDPIGSLMLLVFGFGWAKPVPVNLENIPNRRQGLIFVSSAGIVANILCAFIALLLYKIIAPEHSGMTEQILYLFARINIILAAFNLIPIPPLDGSKILMGFTPESVSRFMMQIEPFGFFIVIGLLFTGALNPVINFFQYIIVTTISLFLPG
ncbi:MAG: site-2 protease family protein [Smithellaceae bacterium]